MPNKKTKKGFTLIEALIVIAILGILSSLGLNAFTKTQQAARNDKRKKDIAAIAGALEGAKTDSAGSARYPACNTLQVANSTPDGSSVSDNIYNRYWYCPIDDISTTPAISPANGTRYLKNVPKDPKTNVSYRYIPKPNCVPTAAACATNSAVCNNTTIACTGFWLLACLEDDIDPQAVNNQEGFAPGGASNETRTACGATNYTHDKDFSGYIKDNL